MHRESSSKNQLIVARASRCWVARAGTERTPWPHPYWRSETGKLQVGVLPQSGLDSSFGMGSARTLETDELELR
jgi:hypothetical protein